MKRKRALMTLITAASVQECQSLFSKVSKSKRILKKSQETPHKSNGRSGDQSTENQEFLELPLDRTFPRVNLLQIWHKFRKSNPSGGILGYIPTLTQVLKDIQVFSPPTTIVIFHLRTLPMNFRASNFQVRPALVTILP